MALLTYSVTSVKAHTFSRKLGHDPNVMHLPMMMAQDARLSINCRAESEQSSQRCVGAFLARTPDVK
jgi:hypothetical protein